MARIIEFVYLALSIYSASATIIGSSSSTSTTPVTTPSTTYSTIPSTTPSKNQEVIPLKPSNTYQVTENVVDIPDDRPLRPIVPTYTINTPINVANTNISVNKIIKNDTGDENYQPKRTSFTYVHITKDTDKNQDGGIKKIFRGIKDYVYTLKKGVVDGLYNYFHNDDMDKKKEKDKHKEKEDSWSQFHRSLVDVKNKEVDIHDYHRSFDIKEDADFDDHDVFEHEFEDY